MKIEIEITDEMIRESLAETVIKHVQEVLCRWRVGDDINRMVQDRWPAVVASVIDEQVANHAGVRKQIAEEMARKLRLQVAKALKEAQA